MEAQSMAWSWSFGNILQLIIFSQFSHLSKFLCYDHPSTKILANSILNWAKSLISMHLIFWWEKKSARRSSVFLAGRKIFPSLSTLIYSFFYIFSTLSFFFPSLPPSLPSFQNMLRTLTGLRTLVFYWILGCLTQEPIELSAWSITKQMLQLLLSSWFRLFKISESKWTVPAMPKRRIEKKDLLGAAKQLKYGNTLILFSGSPFLIRFYRVLFPTLYARNTVFWTENSCILILIIELPFCPTLGRGYPLSLMYSSRSHWECCKKFNY